MIIIGGKEYPFDGVIFLDCDGVINSQDFFVERSLNDPSKSYLKKQENENEEQNYARRHVDPKAVKWLNFLLEKINFGIVVSSTWRSCEWTRDALKYAGIENYEKKLIGYTPLHIKGGASDKRGNEILAWMMQTEYKGPFIALDDDRDFGHIREHLVETWCAHGMTAFTVHLALHKIKRLYPELDKPEI